MNRSSRWTDEREENERFEQRRYPRYEEERYGMQPYGRRSPGDRRPDYGERGFERGSYAERYGFQGRTGGPDYGRFAPEATRGREDYDSGYRAFEETHPHYGADADFHGGYRDYELRRNLASAGRRRWDADAEARERDSARELEPELWEGPGRGYRARSPDEYRGRGSSDGGLGSEAGYGGGTMERGRAHHGMHAGKGPRGYRRSDERIQEDVSEALAADGDIDASDIEVEVRGGEVTLKGEVACRADKRCAEDLIERVSGVRDVSNQLRVRATQERSEEGESRRNPNGPQSSKPGTQSTQGMSPQKSPGSATPPQATTSR